MHAGWRSDGMADAGDFKPLPTLPRHSPNAVPSFKNVVALHWVIIMRGSPLEGEQYAHMQPIPLSDI